MRFITTDSRRTPSFNDPARRMRREELLGRQIAHEWRLPTVTGTGGRPFTMSGMDIHTPAESDAYRYGEGLSPNSETSEAYDTGAAEGAFGGGGGGDDHQPKEWTSMSSAPEFKTEKKARNRSSSLVMFEQEKDERCVNRHNTTRRPPHCGLNRRLRSCYRRRHGLS